MAEAKKAMTIRLPVGLYRAGARMARNRRVSMNRLLQESLRQTLKDDEARRLYAAFGDLAEPEEEAGVEFALPAQAEVLERAGG